MASTNSQSLAPRRSKESEKVGSSFKKQEEIGRGSFATVYKATHTDGSGTETIVAIKSVNMGKLNKKLKDNLTSEISILKSLHHPHIAALIDCKETTQHIHLIMEYVALGDLSQFIKRREQIKDNVYVGNMLTKYPNPKAGGLHEVVVRHFLQQLASALQFLRVRNLIHRDVKPQNLLLNPSPEYFARAKPSPMPYLTSADALEPVVGIRSLPMLKIADFGFARSLPSTSLAETLCGSPLYMAPEILRYEKYDAKADLWSVGTVLYEMVTSRPPFRAANHVELLRKIEKTNDVIKFGDDIVVSDALKKLIRSLLKRDPKERVSFPDFFDNETITSAIPGLVDEDVLVSDTPEIPSEHDRRRVSRTDTSDPTRPGKIQELQSPYQDSQPQTQPVAATRRRSSLAGRRRSTSQTESSSPVYRPAPAVASPQPDARAGSTSPNMARPALVAHRTTPNMHRPTESNSPPRAPNMARQPSGGAARQPSLLRQEIQQQKRSPEAEQAAQDIAFERDYVVVEKRAVEVNALADELEATPRFQRATYGSAPAGPLVRRATQQGPPTSTTGAQTMASRAVSIAQGKRPDTSHQRQNSYERRFGPNPASATSAISRALSLASGRLLGFSPPINFGRGGRSPPVGYSPFPVYPSNQSSLVLVGDSKQPAVDEDTRYVQQVEELATRSDVVFGFAEVKYKQVTPAVPSPSQPGLGLKSRSIDNPEDVVNEDLTVEATVIVSEEALVLYVKALTLLQKAMDTAGKWWSHKKKDNDNSAAVSVRSTSSPSATNQRMNNVVQWTRNRFNEVLEKTDLVRLRLIDSQKRLPEDHPSHPTNLQATTSGAGLGTSADQVVVTSGVTAEKLMYDRALEMSRSAAINELTGEDLAGCEISYVTAIRMLEAILESEDDLAGKSSASGGRSETSAEDTPIAGLEAEDRDSVVQLVKHIRGRLDALRRKLQVLQKRASAPVMNSPRQASPPIPQRNNNNYNIASQR